MKKADDPRHLKRIKILEQLFAESFSSTTTYPHQEEMEKIRKNFRQIDLLIEQAAPQFPLPKIAKIDVAILRLAIFELLYERREPPKVIIDEAVELGKEFGGESSPSFINGVLGSILKTKSKQSVTI